MTSSELPAPDELRAVRAALPPNVVLGTIGWLSPEWDMVWPTPRTVVDLRRDGLMDYAAHPLFGALCLPAGAEPVPDGRDLRRVAEQLPADMPVVVELHPLLSTPRFTHAHVEGAAFDDHRAHANPAFLSAPTCAQEMLPAYRDAFGARLHSAVLCFPPLLRRAAIEPEAFAARLDAFLGALPRDLPLAIELREPEYMTLGYARVLARHGALHVLSSWPGLPPLSRQLAQVPTGEALLVRLVGPLEHDPRPSPPRAPYRRLQRREDAVRADLTDLLCARPETRAIVLANNTFEGCAPCTLVELARALALRSRARTAAP